ncbi:MAG: hypothetical protein JWR19_1972 [Pedosphaera sp.]|nr:hypothetical protein [Pedosphaera sp.]
MSYHGLLSQALVDCQNKGDSKGVSVYRLLGGMTSWNPSYDDSNDKYKPMFAGAIVPENYGEGDLDTLEKLLPEVTDPEFKSRVADLLWIRRKKKNPDHAKVAVQAFLESAAVLEAGTYDCIFTGRIKRAVQLSVVLGRESDRFIATLLHVENLIQKYSVTGQPWICADLMNILLEYGANNHEMYSVLCGKIAQHHQNQNEFSWAQNYWRLQSRWLRMGGGDSEAIRIALVNEAEAIVLEADAATKRKIPSYGAAKGILAKGIEALRRAGGDAKRVEELRKLHAEHAKKSLSELITISIPADDFTEHVQNVIKAVKGQSLEHALLWLGNIPPTNVASLRATLIQNGSPFSFLFATEYLDDEGKTVARTEGASPTAKDLEEEHIKAKMFEMAGRVQWNLRAQTTIIPALSQINSEHNIEPRDFAFLLLHNPFVSHGREDIIARALLAGLRGDWLVATHLIPPQIEHMLRYILAQRGKLTSSLDSEGIEAEYPLGKLLCAISDIEELLGKDLLFDLRGILVEKPGVNLRNRMAHGLMNNNAFYDLSAIYLWWLLLKLCCLPILNYLETVRHGEKVEAK